VPCAFLDLDPFERPEIQTKREPVIPRLPVLKAVEDYRTPRRFATLEGATQFGQGVECGSPLPLSSRPQ
jgi:hypothetical protein